MMEISVKDLRIGDYFANPLGAIGRIDDIRHVFSRDKDGNIEDDCYRVKLAYDEHGESYCWLDIDDLRPIPITPEILVEKLRMKVFEIDTLRDRHSTGKWWDKNGAFCVKKYNFKHNNHESTYSLISRGSIIIGMRYIHELQNGLNDCKVEKEITL